MADMTRKRNPPPSSHEVTGGTLNPTGPHRRLTVRSGKAQPSPPAVGPLALLAHAGLVRAGDMSQNMAGAVCHGNIVDGRVLQHPAAQLPGSLVDGRVWVLATVVI